MSTTASYASEALIGPPSQPISIREFIDKYSCSPGHPLHRATSTFSQDQEDLPDKRAIEEECSVSDLQISLNETLSNPFKYAYLVRSHESVIEEILAANGQAIKPTRTKKRKRTEQSTSEESQVHPEVLELRNALENIALSCWSYPTDAAFFIRPQKNSELNTLTKPKQSRSPNGDEQQRATTPPTTSSESKEEALLVISIYSRLSWGNHLHRSSQHAVLASQTIGDLYDVIPCPSNEIPCETAKDGEIVGFNSGREMEMGNEGEEGGGEGGFRIPTHRGAVVCIESVAYGDGQAEADYADKLIQQIQLLPEKKRQQIGKGACMYEQRFVDLTLRINQPYWLLHQGTCEHFLIIDCIRIFHPNDPKEGYPLTLHIAPPILDLCMACSRVPATLSIVNDIRLGQTPFKICRPCWNLFGEPETQEKVLVVPLPKYEHGW